MSSPCGGYVKDGARCLRKLTGRRKNFTYNSATVLESHGTGGSVLLGDECGRLTAIGWEFDQGDQVTVSKVDIGVVSVH